MKIVNILLVFHINSHLFFYPFFIMHDVSEGSDERKIEITTSSGTIILQGRSKP